MKALRIILTQNTANYRKAECIDNKMTYPLPPLSTIIGAIHNACGYREYVPMDISVQGDFMACERKIYTDNCYLDSLQDDRNYLVKVKNPNCLSAGYKVVASALKKTGNSFKSGKTILTHDQNLLNEYRLLIQKRNEFDEENKRIGIKTKELKESKNKLNNKKKLLDKNDIENDIIKKQIEEINKLIKDMKNEFEKRKLDEFTKPYSLFKTLTKSVRSYELLNDIFLIIHIRANEKVLEDILNNIYNLRSLGRSEDFIDLKEAKIVELYDEIDDEVDSRYSAYLDYKSVINGEISISKMIGTTSGGTKYYIDKDYKIENNKRIFNKKKVIYTSTYSIEECADKIFIDKYNGTDLIVNFI